MLSQLKYHGKVIIATVWYQYCCVVS